MILKSINLSKDDFKCENETVLLCELVPLIVKTLRQGYPDLDSKIEEFKMFVDNYYAHPHLTNKIFNILNKIPLDYTNKSDLCYEETDNGIKPRVIDMDGKYFKNFKNIKIHK